MCSTNCTETETMKKWPLNPTKNDNLDTHNNEDIMIQYHINIQQYTWAIYYKITMGNSKLY